MAEIKEASTLAEAKELLKDEAYCNRNFVIDIPLEERREEHGSNAGE